MHSNWNCKGPTAFWLVETIPVAFWLAQTLSSFARIFWTRWSLLSHCRRRQNSMEMLLLLPLAKVHFLRQLSSKLHDSNQHCHSSINPYRNHHHHHHHHHHVDHHHHLDGHHVNWSGGVWDPLREVEKHQKYQENTPLPNIRHENCDDDDEHDDEDGELA